MRLTQLPFGGTLTPEANRQSVSDELVRLRKRVRELEEDRDLLLSFMPDGRWKLNWFYEHERNAEQPGCTQEQEAAIALPSNARGEPVHVRGHRAWRLGWPDDCWLWDDGLRTTVAELDQISEETGLTLDVDVLEVWRRRTKQ